MPIKMTILQLEQETNVQLVRFYGLLFEFLLPPNSMYICTSSHMDVPSVYTPYKLLLPIAKHDFTRVCAFPILNVADILSSRSDIPAWNHTHPKIHNHPNKVQS